MRKAVFAAMLLLGVLSAATPAVAQTYPPAPAPLTLSSSTLLPGQTVTLSGGGADPGATVTITFASDPVVVATVVADGNGDFTATFSVPEDATEGTHTISAISNGVVLATATVRILASTEENEETEGELAFTGSHTLQWLGVAAGLIALGAVLLVTIRRRRAAASA